jgi:hypothetical protein
MSDSGTHVTDCEQIAIIADAIKRRNERISSSHLKIRFSVSGAPFEC